MSPNHHMRTQRCFGMAISMKALWIGLFGLLSSCSDCACDAAFHGRRPCSEKMIHMPSEVSDRFCWSPCPYFARLGDPHATRTLHAIPIFSQRIQGAKKSSTTGLSESASQYQLSGAVNDANQHARIFSSSQCSNLDLSHHYRQQ
jgi:hypothetical protein